jgi:glycosyltransferase involved in cell wall biosynthesis
MSPRVCVAVPCYNQEALIGETLESLVSQDYDNLVIAVSDDGSQDRTLDIARSYEARYPGRVVVQGHEVNLGITRNVRSMRFLLEGDYVCWFAGDDVCLPGKVSQQVTALEASPDAVMCYHDVDVFDGPTGRSMYRYNERGVGLRARSGFIAPSLIVERCFIAGISAMIRQSVASDLAHRWDIPRAADWLYLIEIAQRGRVIYLDKVLARYRRHDKNASKMIDPADELRSYEIVRSVLPQYEHEVHEGRAKLLMSYMVKFAIDGDLRRASEMAADLLWEFRRRPGFIFPVVAEAASHLRRIICLLLRTGSVLR